MAELEVIGFPSQVQPAYPRLVCDGPFNHPAFQMSLFVSSRFASLVTYRF